MSTVTMKTIAGCVALLFTLGAVQGCTGRYSLTAPSDASMENYAEDRYAQALLYMEASRFELAQQQFAIVEKTAVSEELRQLAHDGHSKATAVIEAKR
jgi:hypothetical protein